MTEKHCPSLGTRYKQFLNGVYELGFNEMYNVLEVHLDMKKIAVGILTIIHCACVLSLNFGLFKIPRCCFSTASSSQCPLKNRVTVKGIPHMYCACQIVSLSLDMM